MTYEEVEALDPRTALWWVTHVRDEAEYADWCVQRVLTETILCAPDEKMFVSLVWQRGVFAAHPADLFKSRRDAVTECNRRNIVFALSEDRP